MTTEATPTNTELARTPLTSEDTGRTVNAFASEAHFVTAGRIAKHIAQSSLVPEAYRGNIANILIAMDVASRIGVSVLAVMQHGNIIHGKFTFDSQFLIASVNGCGRFTPLRFRFQGQEDTSSWGCRAVAKDIKSGEECVGSLITLGLAHAEGWDDRKGSKWKTMPEQMLMYRAAAFWARVYAPELSLGFRPADEAEDIVAAGVVDSTPLPPAMVPGNTKELEDALMREPAAPGAAAEPQHMPPSDVG